MTKWFAVVTATVGGLALIVPGVPARALQPCESGCAVISLPTEAEIPMAGSGGTVRISFQQGAGDGQANQQGNDDIAALAFTLGIPGDGSGTPLRLPCQDGQLSSGAVSLVGAAANDFAVVVENAECTARQRCLCPGAGQQQDDFINIAVYGPKDLPESGPVQIPRLPNGELLELRLVSDQAEDSVIPLHVFCEQDNGDPAKPQFAATLSLGDQSAVDQTADRDADRSQITCTSGSVKIGAPLACGCVGDCNSDGAVSINELIRAVNISLELQPLENCTCADGNMDGRVTIAELIQAVNRSLDGCS
jgi:hypothetical protein